MSRGTLLMGFEDGVFHIKRWCLSHKKDKNTIAKHSSFDQNFDGSISCVLLFPDFSKVIFVPGTKEQFVLSSYKKAIGKDYKRLTFLLIPTEEIKDG